MVVGRITSTVGRSKVGDIEHPGVVIPPAEGEVSMNVYLSTAVNKEVTLNCRVTTDIYSNP